MEKMQFLRPDSAKQLILLKKTSSYFQMRMRQDAKRILIWKFFFLANGSGTTGRQKEKGASRWCR